MGTLPRAKRGFSSISAVMGQGTIKLVERAKAVGYRTLVLTVDVPEVGRRPRELKQGFKMPFLHGTAQNLHRLSHVHPTVVADDLGSRRAEPR